MNEISSNREKMILKKFVSAEDVRKRRSILKIQLEKQKMIAPLKLQLGTKRIIKLEDQLMQEYSRREKRNQIKSVQDRTSKLYDNIILQRKVIKQLLEQESKIIRKPKKILKHVNRLPYLKKANNKLAQSVNRIDSEEEEEEVRISMPKLVIPKGFHAIKLKSSLSPIQIRPRVYSHLNLNKQSFYYFPNKKFTINTFPL